MNTEDTTLELYSTGVPVEEISFEVGLSEENVIRVLRSFRDKQKVKGTYSDDFMRFVAKRDRMNYPRVTTMKELGISRTTLIRAVTEYGFLKPAKKEASEQEIGTTEDSGPITVCPLCSSTKMNKVETLNGEMTVLGAYCKDCGNEFFKDDGKLFKIRWENID